MPLAVLFDLVEEFHLMANAAILESKKLTGQESRKSGSARAPYPGHDDNDIPPSTTVAKEENKPKSPKLREGFSIPTEIQEEKQCERSLVVVVM